VVKALVPIPAAVARRSSWWSVPVAATTIIG